jgi:lipoate---protein ligase
MQYPFKILSLQNYPIYKQLQLEEALLRATTENWCLINWGSPPAIVMGISGNAEELVYLEKVQQRGIPLIKRFSGGGTVIVDEETLFVTLIVNQEAVAFKKEPKAIMGWTEELYAPLFGALPFKLKENDYAIGEKKFGGNAQYIQKERWLHHTSFLWDYKKERMDLLKLPKRRPSYRGERSHEAFLTSLNEHFSCKMTFHQRLLQQLTEKLDAIETSLDETLPLIERPHRKGTTLVELSLIRQTP